MACYRDESEAGQLDLEEGWISQLGSLGLPGLERPAASQGKPAGVGLHFIFEAGFFTEHIRRPFD